MIQKVLPSNPLVAVSDNGAPITSDGGNVLLSMFLNSPVVSRLFNNVEFNDNRKNPRYAKEELLLQMLIQVIEVIATTTLQILDPRYRTSTCLCAKHDISTNTELVLDSDNYFA
ncbi:hypothetical protein DXA89_10525 [Weissella cibaria]|nr:hypothetical protein DXA89_10525 [Weissella cibaria]